MRRFATVLVVGVVSIAEGRAQQAVPRVAAAPPGTVIAADHYDVSQPLRDLPRIPPAAGPTREIPRQQRPTRVGPRARHLAPDPVGQTYTSEPLMPSAATSFDGVGNVDAVLPPDSNGAVGPNHYVQFVNLSFAIFSKGSGATPPALLYGPAAGNTLWQGFGGPCEATNNGDPVVRYDHFADRWFMTEVAIPNFFGGIIVGPFYQCIAVSATPDPTGAYYRYQFSFDKLNDYAKFGVWPDAYYMTMNQYSSVSLQWAGQGVVALERDQMLAGLPARMVYFDLSSVDMNLGGMLPADVDGPAPPRGAAEYFAQVDDDAWGYAPDQLQIWRFHVDWSTPSASTFTGPAALATAPFDSNLCGYARSCLTQPRTTAGLDALSDRLMYRLQYRNFGDHESLVVNHTVDVDGTDHAGVRWYEVRNGAAGLSLYQQGTYAPDVDHRWMGSAAMDGAGDVALGFSVSGQATPPSVRYTGRLATDPLGVMSQGEAQLVAGAGSQTSSTSRWGDYSMLVVDPGDDCTFWYTQEYYAATSDSGWRTRIGSFAWPSCTTPSTVPRVSVVATAPQATEAGLVPGMFTLTRTGDVSAPLTVSFAIRGTATAGADYLALPASVTFAPGQSTASVAVNPIDDLIVEPIETVVLTLDPDASYLAGLPSEAIVTIVSDDMPPDLVVSTITVPSVGGAGSPLLAADTTANQGSAPATQSRTAFYLSTDGSLNAGDVLLGSRSVPALAAGASDSASTPLVIPAGTAMGTYYIIASADDDHAVLETVESNNTRAAAIRIGPDLKMTALTVPSAAAAGTSITVSDITANIGGGDAGASTTSFYLSADFSLDARDVMVGSRAVPALAAGASSAASTSVLIPAGTAAGTYWIFASADANDQVAETIEGNNVAYAVVRIGPDLIVSTFTAPATVGPGQTIVVSDTTKNQGAGSADASTTSFYLSTDFTLDPKSDVLLGGRAVPALAPGASNSGSTSVQIPAGTATGTYFLFAAADANNQVAETLETNNSSYAVVRIGPDLVISAITAPATVGGGQTIVIGDTTKNQGAGAADASTTSFYFSTNFTLDSGDLLLASRAVPALAPGATSSASTSVQIPAGTATGTYYLIASADANNQVPETSETNNATFAVVRIGPDLVASITIPTAGGAGQTMVVGDTTRNQGAGGADASVTSFYLSANSTLDAGDVLLGSRTVPPLAAGATSSASTSVQIPAGTATGTYYVFVSADANNQVPETNETNNLAYAIIRIGPDLIITNVTAPAATGAGQTIVVGDTTRNQGGGVADTSTTSFYLSANLTLDPGDVLVGSRIVPSIAPGSSSSGSTSVQIPPGTATGTYYLFARADANNQVAETSETNNLSYAVVRVGPDLIIAAITGPGTGGAGQPIVVNDTTKNQGAADANASSTYYYLSANFTFDASDVLLGSRTVPPLAAGATSTGSATGQIPAGTAPGSYFVLAVADGNNSVTETNETNNVSYTVVRIGPDLIVSGLAVPSSAVAGAAITVTDTTTNQGGDAAPASTTQYYLSTDFTVDPADVLLGGRAVAALAAKGSDTGSVTLTVPPSTPAGTYYLIARADGTNSIAESVETNNTAFHAISITVATPAP